MIAPPLTPATPAAGEAPERPARAGAWRRALATAEDMLAALLYWQSVSRRIESLLLADDATLKAMGLERNQVVTRALEEARQRRAHR